MKTAIVKNQQVDKGGKSKSHLLLPAPMLLDWNQIAKKKIIKC